MMEEIELAALAGAVEGMRMLKDGTIAVTLHFEPKDRTAVMRMMGEPGASIACARLKDGHAAAPAAPKTAFRDLGPICREAIDLCGNPKFQQYVGRLKPNLTPSEGMAKAFILSQCTVDSRKELDTAEGARDLFIEHVRKPFQRWLSEQK
jgi:glutamate/tyrosine decarboxylase-like PLP-dependent enzyme